MPKRMLALANSLHTAPCYIADCFGVSPALVERLLASRGQYCRDGEGIYDCVARHYGESAARECEACIDIFPWEE